MLLNALLDRRVVFFGGKGGVGKTTCSSAFALAASQRGKRVLLVSTDPAHSTSDAFRKQIGTRERDLSPGLTALEIDGDEEATRYIDKVRADIQKMFSPAVIEKANRQIEMAAASPGLIDVALLDKMVEIVIDRGQVFDLIVFDTAPTGHTLQLLRMPDAISSWVFALVQHRRALLKMEAGTEGSVVATEAADPVLTALERRHERLLELRRIVSDRARTSFVLVAVPERLVIDETARAVVQLGETDIAVGGLIVNRVLPHGLEGEFYRSRKAQETVYLEEIARRFSSLTRVAVEQLPSDVQGLESLARVGAQLVG